MKKIALLGLAMLLAAGLTFGADSKTNRATKTVGLTLPIFAIHAATLITPPIGIQYIASDRWVFGGEFGAASASVDDGDSKAKVDFSNMGLNARWFPNTNSFNVGFAVNQRSFTGSATVDAEDPDTGVTARANGTVDASATVATILISNQWTFDFGMTITADWLVLSGAIGSSTSTKVKASASGIALTSAETADAEKNLEEIGDVINFIASAPGLFLISFGWSF